MTRAAGDQPPPLLLPRGPLAFAGVAAALVNAAMRVAILPLLVAPLFDRVLIAGDTGALPDVLLPAILVVVVGSVALWAQDALLAAAAARTAERWRSALYRDLLWRRPGTLPGSSGGLASRILGDLREVESYFQFGLGSVIAESATLLGIVAYLAWTDLQATLLLLLFGAPTALALRLVGRAIERQADRAQEGVEALGRNLQEGFRHHVVVRAFGADRLLRRRMERSNRATARALTRRGVVAGAQIPVAQVLVFAAIAALMALLLQRVRVGAMTTGELVTYLSLVALLSTPLQLLPRAVAMLQQARAAARRLERLLDAPPGAAVQRGAVQRGAEKSAPEAPSATPGGDAKVPRLRLRDLTVAYAAVPEDAADGEDSEEDGARLEEGPALAAADGAVLRGVDLTLPRRGLVAITGDSGAGKSTLLRGLLGFLPPAAGAVELSGAPLETWPEDELRQRLSYVPQELDLLSGSLRDNLALGADLPDAALWEALATVGLRRAIEARPQRLDTELGEDGVGLSGGQRQRIALARALLRDPDVLLLDEPTSALDEESERALVALLTDQARRRLVIAAAHRPALVDAADGHLEVEGGRVRWRRVPDGVPQGERR